MNLDMHTEGNYYTVQLILRETITLCNSTFASVYVLLYKVFSQYELFNWICPLKCDSDYFLKFNSILWYLVIYKSYAMIARYLLIHN